MDFKSLQQNIISTHIYLQNEAVKAVNVALTIRNWLIGFHITEYEQNGQDRADYGGMLEKRLADSLQHKGLSERNLKLFKQFYQTYPYFISLFSDKNNSNSMLQTLSAQIETEDFPIMQTLSALIETPIDFNHKSKKKLSVPPEKIVSKLSFSHIVELIKIDDDLKRTFYEMECIKGTWSVRELKRQISSLYYERSGLSSKPERLSELVNQKIEPKQPTDIIKNIYAFEFLGLRKQELVEESDLETALLDHLQEFILELGNGFCFEARQKRILIGQEYYFIDLVFYHRVLKCHILIDLKIGAFEHGDIGQLNTYLNFFKEEISSPGDNPPAGILLVAEKDHALVKYATAGIDENLFVQQYLIKLPGKNQLEKYIEGELKKLR